MGIVEDVRTGVLRPADARFGVGRAHGRQTRRVVVGRRAEPYRPLRVLGVEDQRPAGVAGPASADRIGLGMPNGRRRIDLQGSIGRIRVGSQVQAHDQRSASEQGFAPLPGNRGGGPDHHELDTGQRRHGIRDRVLAAVQTDLAVPVRRRGRRPVLDMEREEPGYAQHVASTGNRERPGTEADRLREHVGASLAHDAAHRATSGRKLALPDRTFTGGPR